MAHYVAELMEKAQQAAADARDNAQSMCASAILELWDHRAGLVRGRSPIDLSQIIDVLNRLDPASQQPFYFPTVCQEMEPDAKNGVMTETAREWLRMAEQIDKAARTAILFSVGKAAEVETDKGKPWVTIAEAAGVDGAPDILLIRRLIVMAECGQPENVAEIEVIKDKLALLAEFQQVTEIIEAEWRTQLEKLETLHVNTAL